MKAFKFGLLAPENGDYLREQFEKQHRYRNTLVEIERGRRIYLCSQLRERVPEIAGLERGLAEASSETKGETALALARLRVKHMKEPWFAQEVKRTNELAYAMRKSARGYSGLYSGYYEPMDAAHDAERAAPLFHGTELRLPTFKRWQGDGVLVLRGPTTESIDFEIADDIRGAAPKARRERNGGGMRSLVMRVGMHEKRRRDSAVYAMWPLIMHRPIPPGRIRSVSVFLTHDVTTRARGAVKRPKERWSVVFLVDAATAETKVIDTRAERVAIDVGWRKLPCGGLRVAYWVGSDGDEGQVVLDRHHVEAWSKAESLVSIQKRSFTTTLASVASLIAKLPHVPCWMSGAGVGTLSRWSSAARLAWFVNEWRSKRFDGDSEAFAVAEAWRYHWYHLECWLAGLRSSSMGRRKDMYRVFAATMAKRYRDIVIEGRGGKPMDMRPLVERSDNELRANVRHNRFIANVSSLRLLIEQAASARCATVSFTEYANTTKECHVCGTVDQFDASVLEHTCSGCGTSWDQDANAARVLLARAPNESSARDDKSKPFVSRHKKIKAKAAATKLAASTSP